MKRKHYFLITLLLMVFASGQLFAQIDVADPPVSHWKLDEGSDTIVNDAITGAIGYLQNGDGAEWVDGVDGGAIDLTNATNAAGIIVPDSSELAAINFTDGSLSLSLLVKFDPASNGGAQQQLIIKGSNNHSDGGAGANGTRYEIFGKNGGIYWIIDDDNSKVTVEMDLTNFVANEWTHLVGVRDRTNGRLYTYLNGQPAGDKYDDAGAIDVDTIPLMIGNYWSGTKKLNGPIDDVKIFDEALSAEDIQALYESYTFPSALPVSNWKFDEGSDTIVNDAITGASGYIQNGDGAEWIDGIDGGAIDLTNAMDSVAIIVPDSPELSAINFTDGPLTISMLVKFNPLDNDAAPQTLILKGSNNHEQGGAGANGNRYQITTYNGNIYWVIDDDATKVSLQMDLSNFVADEWTHLVAIRDTTNGMLYAYLNGQSAGQKVDDAGAIDVDTIPLLIGNYWNGGVKYCGAMDDIRIFDEALSAEDIQEMYESYHFPPTGPLVSHWKLDEGSDTIVNDVITGAKGYLQNGDGVEWVDGIDGGAIDLTNATDAAAIIIPDSSEMSAINFTDGSMAVSILVKFDPSANDGSQQQLFLKGSNNHSDGGAGANGNRYEIFSKNGSIYWAIDDDANKVTLEFEGTNFEANEWTHLVGVRDTTNGTLCAYLNGQPAGERTDEAGALDVDTIPLIIGSYWGGSKRFSGLMDDIRIFDEAISAEDIQALYDSYTFPPTGSIVSYWKFDEGSDTIVNDAITGATGYLQNGVGAEWVDGIDGGAIDLTNASDAASIVVPDSSELAAINFTDGPMTISLLVKFDPAANDGAQQELLIKGSNNHEHGGAGANGNRYEIFGKNGSINFTIDDDVSKSNLAFDLTNFVANEWTHLVGVRDTTNGMLYAYLNGQPAGERVDESGPIDVDTLSLLIGSYWGSNKLNGPIDDVRIYDEALSATDVQAIFDSYTWPVIVEPSNDCSLATLTADPGGTITLSGNAGSVDIPSGTTTVTFTATTTDAAAVVTSTDLILDVSSIAEGNSGTAIIHVTAEDGTLCAYTITVNLLPNSIEQSMMDMIEIYPNPANATLTVTNVLNSRISIYAISGALIKKVDTGSDKAEIDVADLNEGVYMMKIQLEDKVKVIRFIKN